MAKSDHSTSSRKADAADNENLLVQKANALTALSRSPLTLSEFKILDAYLARINSHDTASRMVCFEKGEFERLLGLTKINRNDLQERFEHLIVPVTLDKGYGAFETIPLFSRAAYDVDESGVWKVTLECHPAAQQYFFNIDSIGYFRYRLRSIISLKSRYSYILFLYLEQNRFRGTWEVELSELKQILDCAEDPYYDDFRRFNNRLLQPACEELLEKTECLFSCETVKRGRNVKAIRFTVEPSADELSEASFYPERENNGPHYSTNDLEYDDDTPKSEFEAARDLLESALGEFSPAEIEVLVSLICEVPLRKMPKADTLAMRRHLYTNKKLKLLHLQETRETIHNRFEYLRTMIEKDIPTN